MRGLLAVLLCLTMIPAWAQTTPAPAATIAADPALTARIDGLVTVLGGGGDFDSYFSPAFRAQITKEKWAAAIAPLATQLGKPVAIASVQPVSLFAAMVRVRFERGIANVQIAVAPDAPHPVIGLLLTGIEMANDSFAKLTADFRALPGGSGFGIYFFDATPPMGSSATNLPVAAPNYRVIGIATETPAPLGSAFKLWVLGELAREVRAGERRWSDVIPVGPPSLPSGITQGWPPGSPVTLHTLATLMISISDNTATDTLVTLEATKLDQFVADSGAPDLMPVLTTRQMFAIKSPANADLASRWATTFSPAMRRRLLDANAAKLAATPVDVNLFAGKPVAINTLEWFASPTQVALLLERLRDDDAARAILAVNAGTDANTRAKFAYVGFKGGSEPGVVTLNYLVQRKDGRWLAVVGNWHRSDAGVDTLTFTGLMNRALALAAEMKLP